MKKFSFLLSIGLFLANFGFAQNMVSVTVCMKPLVEPSIEISGLGPIHPGGNPQIPTINQDGCLVFSSIPSDSNFLVTAVNDENPVNGVTTLDLVQISRHILNNEKITNPLYLIAADANKSGSITSFDILELRKLILGIHPKLPNNTSWRFVDAAFQFPNPLNPFVTAFPESISLNLTSDTTVGFVPIKVGDVNGSAIPNNLAGKPEDRATVSLILENQRLAPGQEILLPVFSDVFSQPLGLQFSMNFDFEKLEIAEILPGKITGVSSENWFSPEPGTLNFTWLDENLSGIENDGKISKEPLIHLKIKALRGCELSKNLSFSSEGLRSEVYRRTPILQNRDTETADLALVFREKKTSTDETAFSRISPNPASDFAAFNVDLTTAETLNLEIFNVSGKSVFEKTIEFEAGTQRVNLPILDLPSGAVYVLKVSAGGKIFVEKFATH